MLSDLSQPEILEGQGADQKKNILWKKGELVFEEFEEFPFNCINHNIDSKQVFGALFDP